MSLLSQDQILRLHDASVSAGLGDQRAGLLAGIARPFVAGLRDAPSPTEQILLDLHALNDQGPLTDGSVPLAAWLKNGIALLGPREQARLFQAALDELRGEAQAANGDLPPHDSEQPLSGPLSVRLYNIAASCEWRLEEASDTTVLQLIGRLRTRIQAQAWSRRDVPKPGAAYQFRCYRSSKDDQPLSPHLTLGALLGGSRTRSLALNIEWSRVFRGEPSKKFR